MTARHFALIAGLAFLLVGVLGFVPMLMVTPPAGAPPLRLDTAYGYLLGLFPVNVVHSLGVLAIMGLVPQLSTAFGLVPLHGHDVWLHALVAIAAAYFGFGRADVIEARQDLRRAA